MRKIFLRLGCSLVLTSCVMAVSGCYAEKAERAAKERPASRNNDFESLIKDEQQRIEDARDKLDNKAAAKFKPFRREIDAMPPGKDRDEAERVYREWLIRYIRSTGR